MSCYVHLTVRSGYYYDSAVHVGGPRYHVLDIVGMSRTVNVRIVPTIRLVFDVGGRNCDTTLPFLGCLVNGAILKKVRVSLLCLSFRNRCSERGLYAMFQYRENGRGRAGQLTLP